MIGHQQWVLWLHAEPGFERDHGAGMNSDSRRVDLVVAGLDGAAADVGLAGVDETVEPAEPADSGSGHDVDGIAHSALAGGIELEKCAGQQHAGYPRVHGLPFDAGHIDDGDALWCLGKQKAGGSHYC